VRSQQGSLQATVEARSAEPVAVAGMLAKALKENLNM
jgi:hypothetical protein